MPGRQYECVECGHLFRTPDGMPRDTRALMCPACGSYDLVISQITRPAPVVMRAKTPAVVGGAWRMPRTRAS